MRAAPGSASISSSATPTSTTGSPPLRSTAMPENGPGRELKAARADDAGRWTSEELLLRAAWYYYKDELTQDEIARRLSVSRASVGRLLDRARRVGLVSIHLNSEHLDGFGLSGQLRNTFGLAEALVVPDDKKEPFDHHA